MKQYSCLGDYSETKAFLILFPKHDNIFNLRKMLNPEEENQDGESLQRKPWSKGLKPWTKGFKSYQYFKFHEILEELHCCCHGNQNIKQRL